MFPISKTHLSVLDIADYWSRELRPRAALKEAFRLLQSAWWRGEVTGDAAVGRLELLRRLFQSERLQQDQGIVFVVGAAVGSPEATERDDGSLEVDLRQRIPVPNANLDSWTVEACSAAFDALAEHVESLPSSLSDLEVALSTIRLSRLEFMEWTKLRGFEKPAFWKSAIGVRRAKATGRTRKHANSA